MKRIILAVILLFCSALHPATWTEEDISSGAWTEQDLSGSVGSMKFEGNIFPHADNTYKCGKENYRWSEGRFVNIYADGTSVSITGYVTNTSSVTVGNSTYSLEIDTNTIINGNLTLQTGKSYTIGTTQWNSGDSIDGEQIADDTIDDDSIDFSDVTGADLTLTDNTTIVSIGISTQSLTDRCYATEQATGTIGGLVHDIGISTAANSSNIYNLGISTRTNSDDIYSVRQSTADFVKNNSSGTLNGGLILNGNCTFYHDIYFADGTTMNTAAVGSGVDDIAREVKITLGHSGLAYPTHDISTTETYQNSIYVDSITASVDVLAATTDLVYFIKMSSPSSPQNYNAWMVFSGSITVPVAYYHYITTSVGSGWLNRIIPAGTRISLGVQKCDGTSPGGSWGRVTIYGKKLD